MKCMIERKSTTLKLYILFTYEYINSAYSWKKKYCKLYILIRLKKLKFNSNKKNYYNRLWTNLDVNVIPKRVYFFSFLFTCVFNLCFKTIKNNC